MSKAPNKEWSALELAEESREPAAVHLAPVRRAPERARVLVDEVLGHARHDAIDVVRRQRREVLRDSISNGVGCAHPVRR